MGQPIPLELHHIDGDHYNNDLTNLQLLCPTCHSMLTNGNNNSKPKVVKPNIIKPKIIKPEIHYCSNCGQIITTRAKTGLC